MLDIRQTKSYANYIGKRGWTVETKNHVNYFVKKFPLIGSFIKLQRPETVDNKKIKEVAKKHSAFQMVVEPKTKLDAKHLKSIGFKLSKNPYLPTKTLHLDLTKTQKQILFGFRKETKRTIEKNKKLKVNEAKDLDVFRKIWKGSVGIKRHVPSPSSLKKLKRSFGKNALFLLSEDMGAGAIFLKSNGISYYWQAFTSKKGRENKSQYSVVWEGILWSKRSGAKILDFEGIYDKRFPKESWKGFSFFKKGFGTEEKKYPGSFIKTKLLRNW